MLFHQSIHLKLINWLFRLFVWVSDVFFPWCQFLQADAKQQFLAAYQKCLSEGLSQTEAAAKALKTIQGHMGQGGCCEKNKGNLYMKWTFLNKPPQKEGGMSELETYSKESVKLDSFLQNTPRRDEWIGTIKKKRGSWVLLALWWLGKVFTIVDRFIHFLSFHNIFIYFCSFLESDFVETNAAWNKTSENGCPSNSGAWLYLPSHLAWSSWDRHFFSRHFHSPSTWLCILPLQAHEIT